jgi:hypothetical protein
MRQALRASAQSGRLRWLAAETSPSKFSFEKAEVIKSGAIKSHRDIFCHR